MVPSHDKNNEQVDDNYNSNDYFNVRVKHLYLELCPNRLGNKFADEFAKKGAALHPHDAQVDWRTEHAAEALHVAGLWWRRWVPCLARSFQGMQL